MDFKKIKPNDILGFLDDLVAKIPESISSLLTKLMVGILGLAVIYAAYYGYNRGYGSATQEGQELAKDTKSLFLEDIEREYNRKRKNVRMPSTESLIGGEIYKTPKQYESYGRANESGSTIESPDDSLLENDKSIRSFKRKGDTSPLAEINDTNTISEIPIPAREEPTESQKPKRKLYLKDTFDNPTSNLENGGSNSGLDRMNIDSNRAKKILNKKESNKINKDGSETSRVNEPETLKKETGKLVIPEKTQKKEKKEKFFPLDGNE